jgi:hypothetical protein
MKVLGVTMAKALRQPKQRLSPTNVKARWSVEPSCSDVAFLVERELLAQEEIFGGKRSFGSQAEGQQAQQIGKGFSQHR